MTEPTDKELEAFAIEEQFLLFCDVDEFTQIARAVLAKWGTPAVAGEPVAWLSTDCIGERYLCFTKPKDSNPARPLVFGDTTPQPTRAQAGAVPQGWKAVPVNPTPEMWKAAKSVPDPNPPYPPHYGLVWDAMLAASPTPPAEQQVIIDFAQVGTAGPFHVVNGRVKLPDATMQDLARMLRPTYEAEQVAPKAAPGVGNSGFDHQTAADFLNGKTVSDEAVRKFVAASRWAHDERAALSATLLAMHGVLTSREAEIALLKKALLEAEAAPQPAPAPLSESIDQVERALAIIGVVGAIDGHDVVRRESVLEIARRAALAAQGGK